MLEIITFLSYQELPGEITGLDGGIQLPADVDPLPRPEPSTETTYTTPTSKYGKPITENT